MLFYCPLEAYKERYTMQWSAPRTGWLERNWIAEGVQYYRIDANPAAAVPRNIKTGCVVDAVGRSVNCFSQITNLLQLAEDGYLTSNDTIYFDDFWHPGLEALPYAFHLLGIKPKMFAFLHAQSVDEFDFTYPMRDWMRHYEKGNGEALDGIFVCCQTLKDLVVQGGITHSGKVHVTGHPFSSDEVSSRMYTDGCGTRLNKVVYSSRFDSEKNPDVFLDTFKRVRIDVPDVKFVICTGSAELKSNAPDTVRRARVLASEYPHNFFIKEGLTKEEYYFELQTAKVQMNTASQDFVAITLLEASVAGCYPIYPYFRSFPETFNHSFEFMYEHLDSAHAADKVTAVLKRDDLWTDTMLAERAWLHTRFDCSWKRQLRIMDIAFQHDQEANSDPYSHDWQAFSGIGG